MKKYFFLVIMMILMTLPANKVAANEISIYEYSLTDEEKNEFLRAWDIKKVDSEPKIYSIDYFDVSDDGKILIRFKHDPVYDSVLIYTPDGNYECGFMYKVRDTYVSWEEKDIKIVLYGGDSKVITLDQNGELKNIEKTEDYNETYNYYIKLNHQETKVLNGDEYELYKGKGLLKKFVPDSDTITKNDKIIIKSRKRIRAWYVFILVIFAIVSLWLAFRKNGLIRRFIGKTPQEAMDYWWDNPIETEHVNLLHDWLNIAWNKIQFFFKRKQ